MHVGKFSSADTILILRAQRKKLRMKREWADNEVASRTGGSRRWPIWVVQLICELLITGTAPSAIPTNIEIMYQTLYREKPAETPSVNFVRQCRVVVEVLGETLATLKLATSESWNQLWFDGTTRRQIPFTALIVGMLGDEDTIDPVIVSSCIFMDDEKSDTQADGIIDKVSLILILVDILSGQHTHQCLCSLDQD